MDDNDVKAAEAHDKLNALEGGLLGTSAFWQVWLVGCFNIESIKKQQ